MTPLEQASFSDGFRITLLGINASRHAGFLECAATLFDGGRRSTAFHRQTEPDTPLDDVLADLRRSVAWVVAPPHVLVVYGPGRHEVLAQAIPGYALTDLRVLDLLPAAIALLGTLPPRASVDDVRGALRLPAAQDAESLASPVHEEILWALLAEAGRRGLSWPELLQVAQTGAIAAPFERYAFTEAALADVPRAPGVYVMFDAAGEPIYVGKSANLARRLAEYFRPTRVLTPKLAAIRERIHDFQVERVGSELEALLLEQRRIAATPALINVQRSVAEGGSRYAFPLTPVIVACPSSRALCAELFCFGTDARALQLRVQPARLPGRLLVRLAEHYSRAGTRPPRAPGITDWGVEGNELCGRYFSRHKQRITWLEMDLSRGPEALLAAVARAVETALRDREDPAEIRWGDGAAADSPC